MHYAALASGSKGNCHALSDGDRTLLVDAGISLLQIRQRLEALGWAADGVRALALTHEHSDHTRGLYQLALRTGVPIYGGMDTVRAIIASMQDMMPDRFTVFASGSGPYRIGELTVTTFPTSHDVPCIGYRVEGEATVAVATDLGRMDTGVYEGL